MLDDDYYQKIEVLENGDNIDLILKFMRAFKEDILTSCDTTDEINDTKNKRGAFKNFIDRFDFQARWIPKKHKNLFFDENTGDVFYKNKTIWNLIVGNRPYKFFLSLYRNFNSILTYKDLKFLMKVPGRIWFEVVYFGDIFNKEIPKDIKAFIKKEKWWYRLQGIPLKIAKKNP